MVAAEPAPTVPWEAVVTVREAEPLEEELVARFGREPKERGVGVTDLLALRRAYYRLLGPPVPIPPYRQARIDQGRSLHRLLGSRLAHEGVLEARIRREGIVGRIDILSEVPVEVKTAGELADPTRLPSERPDHVEQLGIYCALLGTGAGRLLTIVGEPGRELGVQAVDLSFGSPERILAEVRRRSALLRRAWSERAVESLPRCPWFGRGCEYQESGVCTCTGNEPVDPPSIAQEAGDGHVRPDVEARVHDALGGPPAPVPGTALARFREVLYPRRAYFDRTAPTVPEEPRPPEPAPVPEPSLEKDLYARLTGALESGPPGEVARIPSPVEEPEEEVVGFRGRPLLVRTSRAWSRFRSEELLPRVPQYALDLGLRCAATGTSSGWLVIGYERAEADRDRLQVLEVRFDSVTPFSRLLRERSRGLASALRDSSPGTLPPCPSWMAAECRYRSVCGCGDSSPRVTR